MATYQIDACYYAGACSRVEFPEGKTWGDVKDWYVKWDCLNVLFKDAADWKQFELNSDALEAIDWKRPQSVSVHPVNDDGEVNYDVGIEEC